MRLLPKRCVTSAGRVPAQGAGAWRGGLTARAGGRGERRSVAGVWRGVVGCGMWRVAWGGLRATALLLLAVCQGCGGGRAGPSEAGGGKRALTRVALQLNWFPEAEHGGYYAALVHGFYEEAGLEVTILRGGPDTPVIPEVARGRIAFGISNADSLLLARAQEADVVALLAPMQHSPRCIMVHAASGIERLEELRGVTLAMSEASAFSHFLRRRLPLEDVQIVPYAGNIARFLEDPRYAQQGYVFSEPYLARRAGAVPRALMVSELGFDPYTSVLFARRELVERQPDLVRRMVRASVRGWDRYLSAPEETNRYICAQNESMELDVLAYGVEALRPLVLDAVARRHGIGTMRLSRWQELEGQLVEAGQLKPGAARVQEAFTTRFLPRAAGARR